MSSQPTYSIPPSRHTAIAKAYGPKLALISDEQIRREYAEMGLSPTDDDIASIRSAAQALAQAASGVHPASIPAPLKSAFIPVDSSSIMQISTASANSAASNNSGNRTPFNPRSLGMSSAATPTPTSRTVKRKVELTSVVNESGYNPDIDDQPAARSVASSTSLRPSHLEWYEVDGSRTTSVVTFPDTGVRFTDSTPDEPTPRVLLPQEIKDQYGDFMKVYGRPEDLKGPEFEAFFKEAQNIAKDAALFDPRFNVLTPTCPDGKCGTISAGEREPTISAPCGGHVYSLQNDLHYALRPAGVFLHQIHRVADKDIVKSSDGHYDYEGWKKVAKPEDWNLEYLLTVEGYDGNCIMGLPNVRIAESVRTQRFPCEMPWNESTGIIEISAASMTHYLSDPMRNLEYSLPQMLSSLRGLRFAQGCKTVIGYRFPPTVGSSGRFVGPYSEDLTEKLHLPLTDLSQLYGKGVFRISLHEVKKLEESVCIRTGRFLPAAFFKHLVRIISMDRTLHFYYDRRSLPLYAFAEERISPSDPTDLQVLIRRLMESTYAKHQDFLDFMHSMGFQNEYHLKATLSQSISELSTNVCVAQKGYFFVGSGNQFANRNPGDGIPITFLSAPGIDFNSSASARQESVKYFSETAFLPDGCRRFKDRIKETYRIMFTTCQEKGVTDPTWIAMGLGVFLECIPKKEKNAVMAVYNQVQLELLCEKNWGFHTYWLNPGPSIFVVQNLLDTTNYHLKCRVVLHQRDGKDIAIHLSEANKATSFLNPSDSIAMLQGRMGYWWEVGYGERYVGEEDFAAMSTGIIAHCNITTAFQLTDPVEYDEDGTPLQKTPQNHLRVKHTPFDWPDTLQSVEDVSSPRDLLSGSIWYPNPPKGSTFTHVYGGKAVKINTIVWIDNSSVFEHHLYKCVNNLRKGGLRVICFDKPNHAYHFIATKNVAVREHINLVIVGNTTSYDFNHTFADSKELVIALNRLRFETFTDSSNPLHPYQIMVTSSIAVDSVAQSSLYTVGANNLQFNLHTRHFNDVSDVICATVSKSHFLVDLVALIGQRPDVDRAIVAKILDSGVDPLQVYKDFAAIHAAIVAPIAPQDEQRCLGVIDELLSAHPDTLFLQTRVRCQGIARHSTPLHAAIRLKNVSLIELIFKHAAKLPVAEFRHLLTGTPDIHGNTVLDMVNDARCLPVIKELIHQADKSIPVGLPVPTKKLLDDSWEFVTVMWISTGRTHLSSLALRVQINSIPGMTLRHLEHTADLSDEEFLERSTKELIEVGGEDMKYLTCVVIELSEATPRSAKLMAQLYDQAVTTVANRGSTVTYLDETKGKNEHETGPAPWLDIIKYIPLSENIVFSPLSSALRTEHFVETPNGGPLIINTTTDITERLRAAHMLSSDTFLRCMRIEKERLPKFGTLLITESVPAGAIIKFPEESDYSAQAQGQMLTQMAESICIWGQGMWHLTPLHPVWPFSSDVSWMLDKAYKQGKPSLPRQKIGPDGSVQHLCLDLHRMTQGPFHEALRTTKNLDIQLVLRYPVPCLDIVKSFFSVNTRLLVQDVRDGNCVGFLGAGFPAAAGGPSWRNLLLDIGKTGRTLQNSLKEEQKRRKGSAGTHRSGPPGVRAVRSRRQSVVEHSDLKSDFSDEEGEADSLAHFLALDLNSLEAEVDRLTVKGDHVAYELAAQVLEDNMEKWNRCGMQRILASCLFNSLPSASDMFNMYQGAQEAQGRYQRYSTMCTRVKTIMCIPFTCLLTTNYSCEMCTCCFRNTATGMKFDPDSHCYRCCPSLKEAHAYELLHTNSMYRNPDDCFGCGDCHRCEESLQNGTSLWCDKCVSYLTRLRNPTITQAEWDQFTEPCQVCRARTPLNAHSTSNTPEYIRILRTANTITTRRDRPVIQIHGSLYRPDTVVLTREGYRHLLHEAKMYADFLKAVMSTKTILYMGFSFTDDYLNELRSDVMAMKNKSDPRSKALGYALIPDRTAVHREYFRSHEGVEVLSWDSRHYGMGTMDRFLDVIVRMSDLGAALSLSTVVFYEPTTLINSSIDTSDLVKLFLTVAKAKDTLVYSLYEERFTPFHLNRCITLADVEKTLKKKDFTNSFVIFMVTTGMCSFEESSDGTLVCSLPQPYDQLMSVLTHPFSYLANTVFPKTPTSVIVLAPEEAGADADFQDPVVQELARKVAAMEAKLHSFLNVSVCHRNEDIFWELAASAMAFGRRAPRHEFLADEGDIIDTVR